MKNLSRRAAEGAEKNKGLGHRNSQTTQIKQTQQADQTFPPLRSLRPLRETFPPVAAALNLLSVISEQSVIKVPAFFLSF